MQTAIDVVPVGDRILVLRDRAQTITAGGIELPPDAQELPVEGTVIALGTLYLENAAGCPVHVGDRVLFTAYTGLRLDVGDKKDEYLVMRPDELLAVRRVQGAPQKKARAA